MIYCLENIKETMSNLENNNELVSIITPMYNSEKTVAETINSVLSQTYKNWEMIIVDDCSTDKSFEIVENIVKNHKNIVLLKTDHNSGTAVARNLAIEKAKGKYIAFLDSDDIWANNKLEVQVAYMKEHDWVFSYSNYLVEYSEGKTQLFNPKKSFTNYKQLLRRNDIGCLTAMYDAEKLGKVFMPLDALKREEYAAWLDIMRNGVVAHKINENLATYRVYNSSLTGKKGKLFKYHYRLYRKHEHFSVVKSCYLLLLFAINKLLFKYR